MPRRWIPHLLDLKKGELKKGQLQEQELEVPICAGLQRSGFETHQSDGMI